MRMGGLVEGSSGDLLVAVGVIKRSASVLCFVVQVDRKGELFNVSLQES